MLKSILKMMLIRGEKWNVRLEVVGGLCTHVVSHGPLNPGWHVVLRTWRRASAKALTEFGGDAGEKSTIWWLSTLASEEVAERGVSALRDQGGWCAKNRSESDVVCHPDLGAD
jgi:hypothetical protein